MAEMPATFLLLAYNQRETVSEAVLAAFAQNSEPLQIILSDDCSADGTFEEMNRLASLFIQAHTRFSCVGPARTKVSSPISRKR